MFNQISKRYYQKIIKIALLAILIYPLQVVVPGLLNFAFAGTYLDSWSRAASTLTTSDTNWSKRGTNYYTKRFTVSGAESQTGEVYMKARNGTVDGIAMGNFDAYVFIVDTANVAAGAGSVSVQTGVKISFRFSGLTFKTP